MYVHDAKIVDSSVCLLVYSFVSCPVCVVSINIMFKLYGYLYRTGHDESPHQHEVDARACSRQPQQTVHLLHTSGHEVSERRRVISFIP